jgi:hypothetical protein
MIWPINLPGSSHDRQSRIEQCPTRGIMPRVDFITEGAIPPTNQATYFSQNQRGAADTV